MPRQYSEPDFVDHKSRYDPVYGPPVLANRKMLEPVEYDPVWGPPVRLGESEAAMQRAMKAREQLEAKRREEQEMKHIAPTAAQPQINQAAPPPQQQAPPPANDMVLYPLQPNQQPPPGAQIQMHQGMRCVLIPRAQADQMHTQQAATIPGQVQAAPPPPQVPPPATGAPAQDMVLYPVTPGMQIPPNTQVQMHQGMQVILIPRAMADQLHAQQQQQQQAPPPQQQAPPPANDMVMYPLQPGQEPPLGARIQMHQGMRCVLIPRAQADQMHAAASQQAREPISPPPAERDTKPLLEEGV